MNTIRNSDNDEEGPRNPRRMWPALINLANSYAEHWRTRIKRRDDPLAHRIGYWTRALALGTWFGSAIAGLAAFVFWLQLQAMHSDQRPWVGLSDIIGLPTANAPPGSPAIAYRVVVRNGGKSPALNADVLITGGTGKCANYAIPRERCTGDDCTFQNVELLAGNVVGAQVPRNGSVMLSPGQQACLIARIDYVDADGNRHKTGICLVQSPVDSRTCPDIGSNYAD